MPKGKSNITCWMWIDTDIGDNVDDALAVALAAMSPEVELVGISTVYGAVDVRAALAWKLLEAAGRTTWRTTQENDVRVFPGSRKPLISDEARHAPNQAKVLRRGEEEHWARLSRAGVPILQIFTTQASTLVSLGPLTNLALVITGQPTRAQGIQRLVTMGGTMNLNYAETNIRLDPEAAHIVFSSGIPITMVTKDVTQHCVLPPEGERRIREHPSELCKLLTRMMDVYRQATGVKEIVLNDPLAVAVAIQPDLIKTVRCRVEVELHGRLTRGYTICHEDPTGNVDVAVDVDVGRFLDFFLSRVAP